MDNCITIFYDEFEVTQLGEIYSDPNAGSTVKNISDDLNIERNIDPKGDIEVDSNNVITNQEM